MNLRWVVVFTLIALALSYTVITFGQQASEANRHALAAETDALCRGTAAARIETNRRNAALHTYLVFALRINAQAERLHPTPPILRPLLRQEVHALRLLVSQLGPLRPPGCLAHLGN